MSATFLRCFHEPQGCGVGAWAEKWWGFEERLRENIPAMHLRRRSSLRIVFPNILSKLKTRIIHKFMFRVTFEIPTLPHRFDPNGTHFYTETRGECYAKALAPSPFKNVTRNIIYGRPKTFIEKSNKNEELRNLDSWGRWNPLLLLILSSSLATSR